jgi:ectoine hydroxylase-related dioxygenase (phytanoyl-CoA dioxygenase family)
MDCNGINTRFTASQINKVINHKPEEHIFLTGKAGTLILFDSSTIHAGAALKEGGRRYALTNYYMPSYENINAQRNVFLNSHKNNNE